MDVLSLTDSKDDFCEDALQQKQVKLPEACAQSGRSSTLYEVGDCASKPCRSANTKMDEQCSDNSKSCCIPSQFESKFVNCTGYEVELVVIKACSCGSCDTTASVQVSGKVISARSGSPVQYAEVWLNGDLETSTSYTGNFYITVSDSIDKAVFTIKDTYSNTYIDTTKVVSISNGMGGTISVIIQMIALSDPVYIDSTTEAVLSLGSPNDESSSPVAQVKVPANSFYRSDGSMYTGMVSSVVTFIDPTDDNTQDAIPGVFQFIDEEGSTIDLESKGIFNLQFQDEAGNDLFVDGVIEVSFPDQAAGNFTLWKLNTVTGIWEPLTPSVQASTRKRRQAYYAIGNIDMSTVSRNVLFNIDQILKYTQGSVCYLKSRIYKDESLSEEVIDDKTNYEIALRLVSKQTLITLNIPFQFTSSWKLRYKCFAIPCNNKVASISLTTYQSFSYLADYTYKLNAAQPYPPDQDINYELEENNTTINIIMVASTFGPFYKNLYKCFDSSSHLRFHKLSTPDIYTSQYFSPGGLPIGENRDLMDKVWYPKRGSLYMMCVIKLKVTFQTTSITPYTSVRFHVFSFGGVLMQVKDFLFGIREYEIGASETSQYICAEYKCSGKLEQSDEEDCTRVKIRVVSPFNYTCQIREISENIKSFSVDNLNLPSSGTAYFDAYIPDSYGSGWGVYEAHTSTKDFETARNKVSEECMESYDQTVQGAAVHLYCY